MNRVIVTVSNDLSFDQRMHRTCTTLADAGYDVTLVGRVLPHSVPLIDRPYRQVRIKCPVFHGPRFYARYNQLLRQFLAARSVDIVLACDLDTALAAVTFTGQSRVRKVFDSHELFTEVPELDGRNFVKWTWRSIGQYAIPRFDRCYTVGEALAKELKMRYKRHFSVVRNVPFFTDQPVLPRSERPRAILYQGALNAGRGLPEAISAMHHLPDMTLELAGEGDLSDGLRDLVGKEKLQERVTFHGRIEPGKLPDFSSKGLIGLNLLERRSLNYYFSLANKFFDYMHAGTPSVNMNFPEYTRMSEEFSTGLLLDRLTSASVVSAVHRLCEPEKWERAQLNSIVLREENHWGREKHRLLDIFENL